MKTKVRLNCYFFSNLIVGLLSLNLLYNNDPKTLIKVNNDEGKLLAIYEMNDSLDKESREVERDTDTSDTNIISVSKKVFASKKVIPYVKPSYNDVTGSNLVNYAKHYLGLPYVHAGSSLETGTDCSGFVRLIYREFGINLGRTVESQLYSGSYVSRNDLEPGDLVFYGYSGYATHVTIYIGGGMVIHESTPRDGVKISSINMMPYITSRRLITANVYHDTKVEVKKEEIIVQNEVSEEKDENENENKDLEFKDEVKDNEIENLDESKNLENENSSLNSEVEKEIDESLNEEETLKEDNSVSEQESSKDENLNKEVVEENSSDTNLAKQEETDLNETSLDNTIEENQVSAEEISK